MAEKTINGTGRRKTAVARVYVSKGKGKITINLHLEDELLYCEILDNGIGRKRSAAMKQDNEEHKNSLGIALTIERLELADIHNTGHIGVSIQDLCVRESAYTHMYHI